MRLNTAVILFVLLIFCLFCGKSDQITPPEKDISGKVQDKPVATVLVEVIDGVRHVHNTAPKWGESPKISLEFVRKFGEFYKPFDIFEWECLCGGLWESPHPEVLTGWEIVVVLWQKRTGTG